ncbi:MAG: exo-beta-N-acetylmuramidase NamZ family protein [Candidatus Cyclobacteriaceae bacterium M3_2C_046]
MIRSILFSLMFFLAWSCQAETSQQYQSIITGAEQLGSYLPLLKGKKVGVVVNHTSMVGNTHLVDTLLKHQVTVAKIFSPEHGFRGNKDAGEKIDHSVDEMTGLPIVSLYGNNRKPTLEQIKELDILVFDIQDVGTRFYTYISTMHYVMEACAEAGKPVLVLDRPNPNGQYVDGPVRKPGFESFVGMHPIPVLHGLTVGELAGMINGEGWLLNGMTCDLEVVEVKNYTHQTPYPLPVKPSPNLPNDLSIELYPSLCLFEGTKISVARGTHFPFQAIGYPDPVFGEFTFVPESIEGMAKNPPYQDQQCYGIDFRKQPLPGGFSLKYLIEFYNKADFKDTFFNNYFNTLAGNDELQQQIKAGIDEESIRMSWLEDLNAFNKLRRQYLLYPDQEVKK